MKLVRVPLVLLSLLYTLPALGYDGAMAERLAQFYAPFEGKTCAKALQMIPPQAFVKAIRSEDPPAVLDVRTDQELAIYGIRLPDTVRMPMNMVFQQATLDRLPTDRKIVVVCKGGHRATAVAMGLRQIGFRNVYVLKGGLAALAQYVTPKTAN